MSGTWRNTTYTEASMISPEESFSNTASRVFRKFRVNGNDRLQAELDFLGYPTTVTVQNPNNGLLVTYISRLTPHPYQPSQQVITPIGNTLPGLGGTGPFNPRSILPWMYCQSFVRTNILGNPDMDANYIETGSDIEMLAEYRSLNFDIQTDQNCLNPIAESGGVDNPFFGVPDEALMTRWIERHYRPAGRILTPGMGFMYYAGANVFVNEDVGTIPEGQLFFEPRVRLTYLWREVPIDGVNWWALNNLPGCVNLLPFDTFRFPSFTSVSSITGLATTYTAGLYPQTVLYTDYEPEQTKLATGQIGFNFRLNFTYCPNVDFGSVNAQTLTGATPPGLGLVGGIDPVPGIPRGWNWRIRILPNTVTIANGKKINIDYRPVLGVDYSVNPPVYTNALYKVANLNMLFRPPQINPQPV